MHMIYPTNSILQCYAPRTILIRVNFNRIPLRYFRIVLLRYIIHIVAMGHTVRRGLVSDVSNNGHFEEEEFYAREFHFRNVSRANTTPAPRYDASSATIMPRE